MKIWGMALGMVLASCSSKDSGSTSATTLDGQDAAVTDSGSDAASETSMASLDAAAAEPDAAGCAPIYPCTSRTSCPTYDGCHQCTCIGTTWSCGDNLCADAGLTCPPEMPLGLPCTGSTRAGCGYEAACGPYCTCVQGAWSCPVLACAIQAPTPEAP